MIKLRATFWNGETRQSETQEFEACESALEMTGVARVNPNATREQKIASLCDDLSRPMGGRKVSKVEVIE